MMPGAVAEQAIKVHGLVELGRAFGKADKALRSDMRDALMESAAPVRSDAQALALSEISHMTTIPWSRMRIGAARGFIVYVAPVERGVKTRGGQLRRRPKFKGTLLEKAMDPALSRNRRQVERRFEHMLDEIADLWERSR